MASPQRKTGLPSTQQYMQVSEIRDGVAILKDGTLRSVLLVSSINFALKSEDEQSALISGYVSFLNGIDFPLQIVVQSRKLNIDAYMGRLDEAEKTQENELLKMQISDYRSFVRELVDIGEIMSKRFYVVVPYDPLSNSSKGFFARIKEAFSPAKTLQLKEARFRERKEALDLRVRQIEGGLGSMGLEVVQLDTQGLIELFYTMYNPDTFMNAQLTEMGKLRIDR